jgi:hypothetical protein
MARIQLKIWHAPLAVLSSPPPVGLAEGEVAIAIETNTFVKRPDGDGNAPLITLNGDSNFFRTRCATTAAITLAGLQTIDGVFLNAGEIVLVKDQTDPRQNGFYVASIGAWPRYTRANTVISLASAMAVIETGPTNGDSLWVCTVDRDAGGIGTVAIHFVKPLGSGGSVDPADITPAAIGAVALSAVSQPSGVASLGLDGKVPSAQLPAAPTLASLGGVASSTLGQANGVATLGQDGTVVSTQLPAAPTLASLGGVASSEKGAANGVATLGADGKLTSGQAPALPVASTTTAGVVKVGSGLAVDANGALTATAGGASPNAALFYELTVNFTGSTPGSVSGLPSGWSASISGSDITVTHTAGKAIKSIQYWGYSAGGLERYRLPSASNEASIPYANRTTQFTFRITTAVAGADTDGSARVVMGF